MNHKLGILILKLSCAAICSLLILTGSAVIGQARSSIPIIQSDAISSAIIVDTLDDELNEDGDCSLREAIVSANTNSSQDSCSPGSGGGMDTITFDIPGTITLTAQLPNILNAGPVTVDGKDQVTISGGGLYRIFYVDLAAEMTLQNLVVSNGLVTCCDSIGRNLDGGGLYNRGKVNIYKSTFKNNTAQGSGGGIFSDHGLLTIHQSVFLENKSNYGGALMASAGTVNISDSTFHSNSNLNFYSGYGGAISSSATLSVTRSTFYNNHTIYNGGALWITVGSNALIVNSTLSGNEAEGLYGSGGGLATDNDSTVTIINGTLFGNSATLEGGALKKGTGTLTLKNTIVADSALSGNCSGAITDGGHNIDSGITCGFSLSNGSLNNTNPLLSPLANYVGLTLTHSLQEGSPAIDTVNPADCSTTDQRSASRNGQCDIGAYEYGGTILTLSSSTNPSSVGEVVLFTANLVDGEATTPTGSVDFYVDGTLIGSGNLDTYSEVTMSTGTLAPGTHEVTASYSGDSIFGASTGKLAPDQGVIIKIYLPLTLR